MKLLLLLLTVIGLLSTSMMANPIKPIEPLEPIDIYEHMRTALNGEWKFSAKDKQLDTSSYKNKKNSIYHFDKK